GQVPVELPIPALVVPPSELPPGPGGVIGREPYEETLVPIRVAPPRPAEGPGSIRSFVESLKGDDATFEVIIGQSRILTVKEDIPAGGRPPLIAVGDPSVIEFFVISPRQIRITGLRFGTTDLSITTATGETYTFRVQVVADLVLLEGKLRAMF